MGKTGILSVFVGPMYSGKSDALINALSQLQALGEQACAFRPLQDTRDPAGELVSRTGRRFPAHTVRSVAKAAEMIERSTYCAVSTTPTVVGFDEPHMYEGEFVSEVLRLKHAGIKVLVAGLNLDFRGLPLKPMPELLCYADVVIRLDAAYCSKCGTSPALFSRRLSKGTEIVLPASDGAYDALCSPCWLEWARRTFPEEKRWTIQR